MIAGRETIVRVGDVEDVDKQRVGNRQERNDKRGMQEVKAHVANG